MKLIIAYMLFSFSALANGHLSEFERGFEAGKLSCQTPTEAWVCYIPNDIGWGQNTSFTGRTRADALLQIPRHIISTMRALNKKASCTKL